MIRHSNSFIFSIFIHIVIFIGLFFSYKHIMLGTQEEKTAPLLCIKLSSMSCEPAKKQKAKPTKKKKEKAIKKEIKKIKPKKKVHKKEIIAKVFITDDVVAVKDEIIVEKDISKRVVKKDKKKTKEVEAKPVKILKAKIAPEKEYIDENIAKIVELLQENLHYPRRARKRGVEGEVLVRFTLSVEAHISNIEVLSSSSEILSRGAVQTIKNIDNKLPKPKQNITFNVPIAYTLN